MYACDRLRRIACSRECRRPSDDGVIAIYRKIGNALQSAAGFSHHGLNIAGDIAELKKKIALGETLDWSAIEAKVAALSALDADNPTPVVTP